MRRNASNAEERTMHKQFRLQAAASPPDVEKLLRRLAEGEVNLAGGTPVQVYSEEVRTPQSLGQSGSPGS